MEQLILNNVNLVQITSHSYFDLMGAVGHRTVIFFNSKLSLLGRYLDANILEKYNCSTFVETDVYKDSSILFAVAGDAGIIKLLDAKSGKLLQVFKGHTGSITCLLSFDNFLVSGSADSCVRIWDILEGKCIGVLGSILGHKDSILSIDIHHGKKRIVTAGTDCDIKEWDISSILDKGKNQCKSNNVSCPMYNYREVHKSPITKIKYYGDFIASLSNLSVSIFASNGILLENKTADKILKNITPYDTQIPIILGKIELYKSCKTFDIYEHNLLAISTTGELYLFDLQQIWAENTPCVVETKAKKVESFIFRENKIYMTEGTKIESCELTI
ncbi:Protein with WD40 repeat [Ecytonucleospora hepatopenaei]|uniref:Protein with WD40 repeat n=1 Tax=Ecytonucleospora hepatopenaei TaxID=646526 RepID=A0A1W0E888_9MICR|nr:Protein with WD40 repeat [Ecytonucleospora hepatopenaei]